MYISLLYIGGAMEYIFGVPLPPTPKMLGVTNGVTDFPRLRQRDQ